MIDWDAEVLGDVAEAFGVPGTYRPAAGPAVPVSVILSRGDEAIGDFGVKAVAAIGRGEIRRAQVDRVAEGARLDVGPDTYVIRAPMLADSDRLVWSFGLERVP